MNFVLELDRAANAEREDFRRAVLNGLSSRPRAIPAKFLYDARGSALFDDICELPEYYPTRTETKILRERAHEIAELAGRDVALIEFGAGSSVKSRLLLDTMDLALYAPLDISREHLEASAQRLRRDYPGLAVEPVAADYMKLDSVPQADRAARRIGFFPGSSIGNYAPREAIAFLQHARQLVGGDGALVLGADLKKDPARLHAAYNDSKGVTAAFTLNLLERINRELDGTFDLAGFEHHAFYNPEEGRIEIYVRSLRDQSVTVSNRTFAFDAGECVHTEYSYKYDRTGLAGMAEAGGFRMTETWTDAERLFAVAWLEAA